jgi:dynactin 1
VEHVHVKFGTEPTYDPKSLLRDHVLDQFNFCCQFSFWIYSLQATLENLQKILQICSPANWLRMGTHYPDMAVQERAIDDLVERLRVDKLDENASMQELQRCVTFFKTIEKEHLPTIVDHAAPASQLVATCQAFSAVLDGIFANAKSLTVFSKNRDASMDNMLEELEKLADSFRPKLKQCRRRVAMGASVNEANIVKFNDALKEGSSMMFVLIHFSQLCLQQIKTLSETQVKVLQLNTFVPTLTNCIHQVYGVENSNPVDLFKTGILKLLESLSNFFTTIDFEVEAKPDEKIIAPIVIRAQAVKKELEQAKILREKLKAREADIKELKKCLKLKQEELSEMAIRKDLAESKLGNVHKDYAVNMEKLQHKLDDCQMLMSRKEKEFEETMDHLQAYIDSLESERGELKEKYKSISKKVVTDILAKTTGPSGAASSMSGPSLAITVKDSPMLIQQVQDLRLALKHAQNELLRSRIHAATEKFNSLHSIKVGRKQQVSEKIRESYGEFLGMSKQTVVLHKELQGVLSKPAVVEVSSKRPGKVPLLEKQAPCQHLSQNTVTLHKLCNQAEVVQALILEQLLKGKAGSQAQSSFATFPNVAFAKALQEDTAKFVGRVAFSKALERPQHAQTFPLMLDMAALRKLHYAIPV